MKNKQLTIRLIVMNFLQYAAWGAYLTSLGRYLGNAGLGPQIKWFFAMQGIVSIFMPTLMGIVADRFIQAQKTLSLCHGLAGAFMIAAGMYCMGAGDAIAFAPLFVLYSCSVAFYMPTIAISNAVAYNALGKAGMDPVAVPIRGGTDGARLSYEGLPCPNLCTGGENYHGRYEYIPIEDMEQCVEMIKYILTDGTVISG